MRATVWLTQGSTPDTVQVWLCRPVLRGGAWELPDGAPHVLASEAGEVSAKFATWGVDAALAEFRVVPETPRECVRVGGAGELAAAAPR